MTKQTAKGVIVFGATGGIGRAICHELASRGTKVVGVARTMDKLHSLQNSIGEQMHVMGADVTNIMAIAEVFRISKDVLGKIDAVILCIGVWRRLDVDAEIESVQRGMEDMYRNNFLPNILPAHVAYKELEREGGGSIFHFSSHAATRSDLKGNLSYSPFKAAATMYVKNMQSQASKSVHFCDLRPAIVNTPEASALLDTEEKRALAVQTEEIATWIADNLDNPPPEKEFVAKIEV